MQTIPIHWLPSFPDPEVFPQCTISAAGYVAQYSIKQQLIRRLLDCVTVIAGERWKPEYGINGRIEVGDHECRAWKTGRLVDEEVSTATIAVVGD